MNLNRFFAVFKARNIEFFRDKASLSWNLVFPVLLLIGFAIIFSGDGRSAYKVGFVNDSQAIEISNINNHDNFKSINFIDYIEYENLETASKKLVLHSIDLVIEPAKKQYWINKESSKSYLVEKIFSDQIEGYQRLETSGKKIRYIDWVLPGILGMNMMFSCLFGVGYVIVRYRKNAVLKRLKATPLSAFEFVSAQLLSRLFIVMCMSAVVYYGCNLLFDFFMLGSYLDLIVIGIFRSLLIQFPCPFVDFTLKI